MIGFILAAMGFGLMVGPPVGSIIFGAYGFAFVFYFFSIWIALMLIGQIVFIPSRFNSDKTAVSDDKDPKADVKEQSLLKGKGKKNT